MERGVVITRDERLPLLIVIARGGRHGVRQWGDEWKEEISAVDVVVSRSSPCQ